MAMFEQAMHMFSPFGQGGASPEETASQSANPTANEGDSDQIAQLQEQIMAMQAKLNELANKD